MPFRASRGSGELAWILDTAYFGNDHSTGRRRTATQGCWVSLGVCAWGWSGSKVDELRNMDVVAFFKDLAQDARSFWVA